MVGEIKDCSKCELHKFRNNIVLGNGSLKAQLFFVGEAPGRKEDLKGKPFVGDAGKYLNELLVSIGLQRDDVYITNLVRCKPLNNRDPFAEEIRACEDWLIEELRLIKPKIVVTLGKLSTAKFFGSADIGKIHGTSIKIGKLICFAMYHPAATLYRGNLRQVMEEDMGKLKRLMKEMKLNVY